MSTAFAQPKQLPDEWWEWGLKWLSRKSLTAFSLNIKLIPTCMQYKDTNPLPYSIVALWHFYLIYVIHLWIILSVIILIKQFDFHQLKYIILGHFPCGHCFFFLMSETRGTILLCLEFFIRIDSVLKSNISIQQKSDLKVYLGSHISVHPS